MHHEGLKPGPRFRIMLGRLHSLAARKPYRDAVEVLFRRGRCP